MTQMSDREMLQELAAKPIGSPELMALRDAQGYIHDSEAVESGKRANKIWLPSGKRPASTPEARARQSELKAAQIDIEDAVEARGGERGHLNRPA